MSRSAAFDIRCEPQMTGAALLTVIDDALAGAGDGGADGGWLAVSDARLDVDPDVLAALPASDGEALCGSWSPVPVVGVARPVVVPSHPAAPPPASVLLPCADVCALSIEALRSLTPTADLRAAGWREALVWLAQRLTNSGWRHLVSPSVAFGWDGATAPVEDGAAWTAASVATATAAHAGFDAHRTWAATQVRPVRVVVDGNCVTDDVHNGTQVVVLEIVRSLAAARPDAEVALAVRRSQLGVARGVLAGSGVSVVERRHQSSAGYDVAYRPYQSIDPSEVAWLASAGARTLVGQLDTIGYSNPSYHPSPALFHTVRNLQRHMMRSADGVTFISEFGLRTAVSECPDLAGGRLHVVGCGVDVVPPEPADEPTRLPGLPAGRFVACLSATFHHKNRAHAIRTFAHLCRDHGYQGALVIAGPQPVYGRSPDDDLIATLPSDVAARVHRVGHVPVATKWWLLRRADLVLYPSVVEGFGLVPFEAAIVGTPSLSYRGTALAEVLAAPEPLVDSWDPAAWAGRAARIVGDPEVAAGVVASVRAAAARHPWSGVAERTWDAIDTALAMPSVRMREEGPFWSAVRSDGRTVAHGAPARHFAIRLVAAARRRLAARRAVR